MIIYMAHNTQNGTFYYGKTQKTLLTRRRQHEQEALLARNGSLFHKAIRKWGAAAFSWHQIAVCLSPGEANARERFWIALSREVGHRLYNLSDGGDGGGRSGSKHKPPSAATKLAISASLRAHYADHPGTMTGRTGTASPAWGRTVPLEVRDRISRSHRLIAKPHLVGPRNPSARPIRCVTTGEDFAMAKLAAERHNCDLSSIIKCCRGKLHAVKGNVYAYREPGVFGWDELT